MEIQRPDVGAIQATAIGSTDTGEIRSGTDVNSLSDSKRIAIIDRSIMRRECLAFMLRSRVEDFHFVSANCPDELPPERFDTVLLSIGTGPGDLCQARADMSAIKQAIGDCPVIAIADCEHPAAAIELLRFGFRGYVSTSFEVGLALAAIKLVCFGGTFVPPCAVGLLGGAIADGLPAARVSGRELTIREEQVVQHLRSGKPNKIIAYSLGISESTVKVHLQNIMRKMNASNRTEVASRSRDLAFS
jgi:DNA-binding NarL/FixJ family response regulator